MAFRIPKPDPPEIAEENKFVFMGWEFKHNVWTSLDGYQGGSLISFHRLPNPEFPALIYAYHNYNRRLDPKAHGGRDWAASWLIAHWYEHFFGTCPCLNGDGPSNFKDAFIETLLAT